jgi:Protein of unknown function (DUF3306)
MTDREKFLERWSRRKIEAERQTPEAAREDVTAHAPEEKKGDAKTPASGGDPPAPSTRSDKAPSETKPAFDIASLPSLESITAATDVRAFLAPGVPAELTRAALRRAWITDPAIRNFKGLAENDWDFTDPNAMAGFTDLPADYDVKKLVAQIFGEKDKAADPPQAAEPDRVVATAQAPEQPTEIASADEAQSMPVDDPTAAEPAQAEQVVATEADIVHRNTNTAMHNSNSVDGQEEAKVRRTHGRALPQ